MTTTKQQADFIKTVANCLAKNFMLPLFDSIKERNYSAKVGCLAELLDWSKEFCDLYFDKIINRGMLKQSNDNRDVVTTDDLIITFGRERLKKFFEQNASNAGYFFEKYAAIEL